MIVITLPVIIRNPLITVGDFRSLVSLTHVMTATAPVAAVVLIILSLGPTLLMTLSGGAEPSNHFTGTLAHKV